MTPERREAIEKELEEFNKCWHDGCYCPMRGDPDCTSCSFTARALKKACQIIREMLDEP